MSDVQANQVFSQSAAAHEAGAVAAASEPGALNLRDAYDKTLARSLAVETGDL